MIPVSEQPKPCDFDDSAMRRKGAKFLEKHHNCDRVDFKGADYWKLAASALNKTYVHEKKISISRCRDYPPGNRDWRCPDIQATSKRKGLILRNTDFVITGPAVCMFVECRQVIEKFIDFFDTIGPDYER